MITLSQFGNVPPNLAANARATVAVVNEIFAAFPGRFRFTSGYRTPQRNAAVNGAPNSFHVRALAADFVPVDGRYPAAEVAGVKSIVERYGGEVIIHNAGSGLHYHIEPRGSAWTSAASGLGHSLGRALGLSATSAVAGSADASSSSSVALAFAAVILGLLILE